MSKPGGTPIKKDCLPKCLALGQNGESPGPNNRLVLSCSS